MNLYEINQNDKSHNNVDIVPLVSIVIATYRRDSSLEKALMSLINQSYEFIEIIVVDDNAAEIWNQKVAKIISNIRMHSKKEIIYIKNEVNKGSAKTRNVGIVAALGEYITFLDDDDIYLPDKIKNQVEHIIEQDSDFSITDLCLYDENENLIEVRKRNYIKKTTKNDLLRYHLMYHMTGTDTMMFKKDYLLNLGGFPPIDVGDEFYLMQKAIENGGKLSYLPRCDIKAYVHTITDGLSSGDSKINGENQLYQYKRAYFNSLTKTDIRYIKARHFAVLAFAEIRRKNMIGFLKYGLCSFLSGPISCVKVIRNMR